MKGERSAGARGKFRQSRDADLSFSVVEQGEDNQIIAALSRGLAVLDAFSRADTSLGNAELAARTGLTKSTVSRLAYTLARHNYLQFDPHSREYRLGVGAITLGAVALAMTNVRTLALPLMRELAAGSRFNVGLGTRVDRQMVYTDACEGDALISLRLLPGSRIPIATSAMGRAYLARLTPGEREAVLAELRPRYDDDWPTVLAGVDAAVAEYERYGYCSSIGDWHKDINGIAVSIVTPPGEPVRIFNLGGPAYALSEAELRETHAPRLLAAVRTIEDALGIHDARLQGGPCRQETVA
ncbi:IclR family transcriptional regulator [Sphingomonas sp. 35-24ZXX]|uniref:IclR family transcriptional regulator n=1 Tax=Sphingomonas sp. 35-24ZXX TaxID=1545915 RepID=UPI00068D3D7C|nr:IclR family transcriptional regulator [Sphingomonas sp. 35-24ZXX]